MSEFSKEDLKLSVWDGSKYLTSEEDIRFALELALEDYNEEAFKLLIRDIIKARARMSATAKKSRYSHSNTLSSIIQRRETDF